MNKESKPCSRCGHEFFAMADWITICNDCSEAILTKKTWDEIHIEYMKIPLNKRPLFFDWVKKNYEPPIKKLK